MTRLRWVSIRPARSVSLPIALSRAGMSMLTLLDMSVSYPAAPHLTPSEGHQLPWSRMFSVGRHSGAAEQAASPAPTGVRRRSVLVLAIGMTVTLVAWGVLVGLAIEFGKEARSGEPEAWTFLVLAALGATACLFLALLLGARALAMVRGKASPPPPPRPVGGRRRKVD